MRELHLFAGAGFGIIGGMLLGHTCVCAVEIEPFRRQNLLRRQRDGILPQFPIWDDVTTFDGKPWRGRVDVVCGGFPCQDISLSGKGAGIEGGRSGLWSQMARVVCEIRPKFVLVENSPALVVRGLGRVIGDLASMGYNAQWGVFRGWDVGSPQLRERLFLLAYRQKERTEPGAFMLQPRRLPRELGRISGEDWIRRENIPVILRGDDAGPDWLDRCYSAGDGQIPSMVKLAWQTLAGINADTWG